VYMGKTNIGDKKKHAKTFIFLIFLGKMKIKRQR